MQMMLKLQHSHHSKEQKQQVKAPSSSPKSLVVPTHQCPQFLKQILYQSSKLLAQKSKNQIKRMAQLKENTVYQTLSPNNLNYLAAMFSKANPSEQSYIKQLMGVRQEGILQKIANSQIQLKEQEDNDTKIKRIKLQLDGKIKQMKKQLGDFTGEKSSKYNQLQNQDITGNLSSRRRNNSSLVILQDFKKKQYWKDKSFQEQNRRVKSFLHKMKKQKSQVESKFNQDLQDRQRKLQSMTQAEKQAVKQQKHREYIQNIQKQYKQKSVERKEYFESKKTKQQQIIKFLQSINYKQPIHLKFQKDYKDHLDKQQQHRQKVLKQIRQKRPHYNLQQVEEHQNQYVERKQKYLEQKEMKAEMEGEMLNNRYQQIRQLYHSKFHKQMKSSKKHQQIEYENLVNNRKKVLQYANTVKESFKPLIDKRKTEEMKQIVNILKLSNDPTKRKVIKGNGIIQFQDKKQNDRYQKGVSYLEQLRSFNDANRSHISTSKRYEQRSNSALELSTKTNKKIDYLRQSRPSLELKPTISDWKQLLVKKDFSARDKLQRVLDRAESLQIHANQKQVQLRNMKNQQNTMDIKQQADKYYLESIAARMVLLKDVVMK